jgi:hypothetical protein
MDPAPFHAAIGGHAIGHEILAGIDGRVIALQKIADHGRKLVAESDAPTRISVSGVGVVTRHFVERIESSVKNADDR